MHQSPLKTVYFLTLSLLLILTPVRIATGQTTTPKAQAQATNVQEVQVQELPASIPAVAEWLPDSVKAKFGPQQTLIRELSALAGMVQSNESWMYPGAAYVLLSPNNPSTTTGKGGTKSKIVNVAALMGNVNLSFYRYPVQAWQETVPASRFRDGFGINLNLPDSQLPAALKQLKAMGVTKWRMDIGWGAIDYRTGQFSTNFQRSIVTRIALCKQAGIRPLFCLDTNPAVPCPMIEASVTVVETAKAGDTSLIIKTRPGEVPTPFLCGLSHVTLYMAAQWMVVGVDDQGDGNYRLTFAKPLARDYTAGETPPFAYLKYRPLSDDHTDDQERTYNGFLSFVSSVQSWLETQKLRRSKTDPGYDIEYLNENSNGQFFDLGNYIPGKPRGNEITLYRRVVAQIRATTANHGLVLINGYYNQLPPASGAQEPAGSNGGSSHFYQGEIVETARIGFAEDAFSRDNDRGFIPSATMHAPEIIFSAYKFENLSRQMSPFPIELWGATYGRGIQPRQGTGKFSDPIALEPTGIPARPTHWYMTEWGDGVWGGTAEQRYRQRAKYLLRGNVFPLGKGIERIYWFAAADASLGELTEDANKLPAVEPLTVTVMKRMNAALGTGKITKVRRMDLTRISETHGHVQFRGNGTIEYPDLPNRDILFSQSVQVDDTTLGAFVYVPTLDYKKDLPDENYTLRYQGVKWNTATSKATYRDFLKTQSKTIKPTAYGSDWVEFTLSVSDWPRWLELSGV